MHEQICRQILLRICIKILEDLSGEEITAAAALTESETKSKCIQKRERKGERDVLENKRNICGRFCGDVIVWIRSAKHELVLTF